MKIRFASCFAAFALILSSMADQPQSVLKWEELAAHAGLVGISPKSAGQFKVDLVPDMGRRMQFIRAEVHLSQPEWEYFNNSANQHLFSPWEKGKIDDDTWKSTIDLILPFDGTVKVDRIKADDKAVILMRPETKSIRLYVLSPDGSGSGGVLYYFFKNP